MFSPLHTSLLLVWPVSPCINSGFLDEGKISRRFRGLHTARRRLTQFSPVLTACMLGSSYLRKICFVQGWCWVALLRSRAGPCGPTTHWAGSEKSSWLLGSNVPTSDFHGWLFYACDLWCILNHAGKLIRYLLWLLYYSTKTDPTPKQGSSLCVLARKSVSFFIPLLCCYMGAVALSSNQLAPRMARSHNK